MDTFFDQLRQYCEALRVPLISPETQQFMDQLLEKEKPVSILEI